MAVWALTWKKWGGSTFGLFGVLDSIKKAGLITWRKPGSLPGFRREGNREANLLNLLQHL
uniref:Uncharacterized protein n=1 Tax=Moniliophthora roreri TaxID=221103 RepID=A0A0W0F1Q3_MONRR